MSKRKSKKTEVKEETEAVVKEPAETEQAIPQEETAQETPKPRRKKKSDVVKVKVLIGTLEFEDGVFEKDSVFETSRERAERFEKTSVQILE